VAALSVRPLPAVRRWARGGGLGMLVLRRLLLVPVVLWAVVTVVFAAMRMTGESPAAALAAAGTNGLSSAQVAQNIARISKSLGLNHPLWLQYVDYLGQLLHLDLGTSYTSGDSVGGLLATALPVTIELTVAAMLIAVIIGVVSGLIAAAAKGSILDAAISGLATVSFSLPWFALGVLGIVVFGVHLHWLPVIGRMPSSLNYVPTTNFVLLDAILQDRPDLVLPWLQHLVLPATTLALSMCGFITRTVRASVLEVLGDDFTRTARMKGLSEPQILRRHVLRNSSLPIVTVIGLQFGALLGGSVITEQVFSYPGVGSLLISAVQEKDYPVVQGAVLAIATLFVLVNLIVDVLYLVLDPRLRKA
jgi:peptide/nickel transport system permease protein